MAFLWAGKSLLQFEAKTPNGEELHYPHAVVMSLQWAWPSDDARDTPHLSFKADSL